MLGLGLGSCGTLGIESWGWGWGYFGTLLVEVCSADRGGEPFCELPFIGSLSGDSM
jgi:hypothetical protein